LAVTEAGDTYSNRPLSIDPGRTALGLTFILTLGLFFIGLVKTMQREGSRNIASALVALGALVAVVGIAEVSTSWGGVYASVGLALPPDSMPHGPFASRNHYAGWMLMAFAVTLAYLFAMLNQPLRSRIGHLLYVQVAATVMAVALVQTRSRVGIFGLMLASAAMCGIALSRTRSGRTLIVTLSAVMLVVAIAATGPSTIVNRFATPSWSTAHGRLPIWRQAATIARDFAVAGSGLNTYQTIVRSYPTTEIDEPYEGAHNDYLQLVVEGGILVGLPALALTGFFIVEIGRRFGERVRDRMTAWLRMGAVLGLLLVAGQEAVDFILQIPGNAALFAVLAALAVHTHPYENLVPHKGTS
jgi:O-antigen ligase